MWQSVIPAQSDNPRLKILLQQQIQVTWLASRLQPHHFPLRARIDIMECGEKTHIINPLIGFQRIWEAMRNTHITLGPAGGRYLGGGAEITGFWWLIDGQVKRGNLNDSGGEWRVEHVTSASAQLGLIPQNSSKGCLTSAEHALKNNSFKNFKLKLTLEGQPWAERLSAESEKKRNMSYIHRVKQQWKRSERKCCITLTGLAAWPSSMILIHQRMWTLNGVWHTTCHWIQTLFD